MSTKEEAVDLARRGFAVFPCKPRSKAPATVHGFYDGSTDPKVVSKMFDGRDDYNIAVATGPVSKIWVLDEDGPAGMAVVADLEKKHGALPSTVSSLTGRDGGGRHRWFRYPDGREINSKNKIEIPGYGKVSVDQKGAGGYVIVPPSIHFS